MTVSIIGYDGQTSYGSNEDIFTAKNLPSNIERIFFTNTTAWQAESPDTLPPNRFAVTITFSKPPVFDPNPLVSEPTRNDSQVYIKSEDIVFFRACRNIASKKLTTAMKWYSFIHAKFAYDIGLWLIALPYSLYWITHFMDRFFPSDGPNVSFRIPFYIYSLGISILLYRTFAGYIKWAFPVNVLEENKDRAWTHRVFIGAVISSLVVSGAKSVLETFAGINLFG
ncbi:hypothetical protein [Mesorhizobium sp. J428]|uniref:hypothetical protein n=1 Tax=Mesorhizobium sp. J428 TaxID=2898440 RepID=UPI002151B927|nr:hypothetical protein [Mesorhizobium sp. J428]MCR5856896.1 hypothetical protein [Mesorhizobium sp. J428]